MKRLLGTRLLLSFLFTNRSQNSSVVDIPPGNRSPMPTMAMGGGGSIIGAMAGCWFEEILKIFFQPTGRQYWCYLFLLSVSDRCVYWRHFRGYGEKKRSRSGILNHTNVYETQSRQSGVRTLISRQGQLDQCRHRFVGASLSFGPRFQLVVYFAACKF